MAISSNTLFQFTAKRETLEAILTLKYLWPRYCTEYYWDKYRFSLPMMCLCDIPLSQTATHIKHYGKFGIGISKNWANKITELSTVIYTRRNSILYKKVLSILKKHHSGDELSTEECFLLSRVKKYSGNTYCCQNGKRELVKNVKFYDEREWRFIPTNLVSQDIIVETNQNQNENQIAGDNDKTKGIPTFEYDDIRYLIVKDDSERIKLIDFIDNELKSKSKTKKKEKTLLKSKILTVKQIEEDF